MPMSALPLPRSLQTLIVPNPAVEPAEQPWPECPVVEPCQEQLAQSPSVELDEFAVL